MRSRLIALTGILEPQGAIPSGSKPPWRGGLGLSPGAWGAPLYGNGDSAQGIFGAAGRVLATALCPDPPKKGLVPHSSGWWDGWQIQCDLGDLQNCYVQVNNHDDNAEEGEDDEVVRYTGKEKQISSFCLQTISAMSLSFDPKLIPLFDGQDSDLSVQEWIEKAALICHLSDVKVHRMRSSNAPLWGCVCSLSTIKRRQEKGLRLY